MPVTDEIAAQVKRLFHVERWRVGTIAGQLKLHHETVRRILGLLSARAARQRSSRSVR